MANLIELGNVKVNNTTIALGDLCGSSKTVGDVIDSVEVP
jgi:hypothetical protein